MPDGDPQFDVLGGDGVAAEFDGPIAGNGDDLGGHVAEVEHAFLGLHQGVEFERGGSIENQERVDMARVNIFEFADKYWCPKILRDMLTDYLAYLFGQKMNVYKPVIPIIKKVLGITKRSRIVELCAGAGCNGVLLQEELDRTGEKATVLLTDKYPNLAAFEQASKRNSNVRFTREPIDALEVPPSIDGVRAMYTSFHHFDPPNARKILQDAVDKEEAICLFEMTEPNLISYVATLLSPFITLGFAPKVMRPMGLKRFALTYVIPAFLFIVLWDGIASMLRTYTPHELGMLVKGIRRNGYKWEIGREQGGIIFLVGYPNPSL